MLVKQSKNTFIRFIGEYGYLMNQMTRHDRIYDDIGADFLKRISRKGQEVDVIVADLKNLYGDSVSIDELKTDFCEFIKDLADHKFLVIGETEEDLEANDISFSYSLDNPKTFINDFSQFTTDDIQQDSQTLMEQLQRKYYQLHELQFELTSRCNERCIHCYIPNAKKDVGGDMPYEKVCSLIDEFAELGGFGVTLSGGEVFIYKDIMKVIQYCREKDMCVGVLSNLTELKDEQIPLLKEANLSIVQVSLYSMDPEIHDRITLRKGSHAKTKAAIEKLVAADIPVQISCPIMKANKEGYDKVLAYAQSLKVKAQTDFIMMAQADLNTQNLANRIDLQETEKVIRDIIEYDVAYREETLKQSPISSKSIEQLSEEPFCGAGINSCCISSSGDVYPCPGWSGFSVGNIYSSSLADVWKKSEKLFFLRNLRRRDLPQCLTCEARDFCAPCLVRNYNENDGDMLKVTKHFCDVAFLNMRLDKELIFSKVSAEKPIVKE